MATVCEWFDLKTTRTFFAGLASKPVATIFGGLASKPAVTVFSVLVSKPVATVFSSLASKRVAMVSPGLASKTAVDFLVEPQNKGGGGFSSLGVKTGSSGLVIWESKLPRWFLGLGLKPSGLQFVGCTTKPTRGVGAGHASRSSGLLCMEASLARVS
jgi:hypothetical protein